MNIYQIPKLTRTLTIDAHWRKMPWSEVPALQVDQSLEEKPIHFPQVEAKLAYDNAALYVIFHVEDQFVRAKSKNYQDEVFWDSCVEFFFTPGMDSSHGYFNLEVNCGGTALFHHQKGRRIEDSPVSQGDFERVQIAHTLPQIVDPEINEPVNWVVEYRLPYDILIAYTQVEVPTPGTKWRANFYKCADGSSHPHWLSWSSINTPKPDFHRPEYFGQLVFK